MLGISGQALITGALTDLRNGRALTFEREYCIETLCHGILHNNQRTPLPSDLPLSQWHIVESLHQVVARQTYLELLRVLGGRPAFLREIREHGLAYPKSTERLHALLQRLGLMDAEFVIRPETLAALRELDFNARYGSMGDDLASELARLSAEPLDDIQASVRRIMADRDL